LNLKHLEPREPKQPEHVTPDFHETVGDDRQSLQLRASLNKAKCSALRLVVVQDERELLRVTAFASDKETLQYLGSRRFPKKETDRTQSAFRTRQDPVAVVGSSIFDVCEGDMKLGPKMRIFGT
jgi:hypothetical protein